MKTAVIFRHSADGAVEQHQVRVIEVLAQPLSVY
jgi:hypothetical protein